jgi:hypothetical protein
MVSPEKWRFSPIIRRIKRNTRTSRTPRAGRLQLLNLREIELHLPLSAHVPADVRQQVFRGG